MIEFPDFFSAMGVKLTGCVITAFMLNGSPAHAADSKVDGRPDYAVSGPVEPLVPRPSGSVIRQLSRPAVAIEDISSLPGKLVDRQVSATGSAIFKPLTKAYLLPGKPWEFWFRLRHSESGSVNPSADSLPESASLVPIGDGWYQINWTPSYEQIGLHELIVDRIGVSATGVLESVKFFVEVVTADQYPTTVSAIRDQYLPSSYAKPLHPDNKQKQSNQPRTTVNTIQVSPSPSPSPQPQPQPQPQPPSPSPSQSQPPPGNALTPDSSQTSKIVNAQSSDMSVDSLAPYLNPIATQIVSAGRTLSIRIDPQGSRGGKSDAIIAIDRLPQNGSLDENPDGSKTFYWQTGDNDQGEHRFRFTVANPNQPQLQSSTEVLIIVGDPSRSNTSPIAR